MPVLVDADTHKVLYDPIAKKVLAGCPDILVTFDGVLLCGCVVDPPFGNEFFTDVHINQTYLLPAPMDCTLGRTLTIHPTTAYITGEEYSSSDITCAGTHTPDDLTLNIILQDLGGGFLTVRMQVVTFIGSFDIFAGNGTIGSTISNESTDCVAQPKVGYSGTAVADFP
jgi:hypothetical protein